MKEFEKWFKKAENDLLAIRNNISASEVPADVCCFHAQQAAEKYLKAFLIAKSSNFPKTHDLELLVKIIIQQFPAFASILPYALWLTNFGVLPRYPDEIDEPTLADAQQAHEYALAIKAFVIENFFH